MAPKLPIPSFLSQNYEFLLFALLFLYSAATGEALTAGILGISAFVWFVASRLISSKKKEPSANDKKFITRLNGYKKYAYYAIVACFILFLILKSSALFSLVFLVLLGLLMVFVVGTESVAGYYEGGLRNEVREIVLAILWALCIWFILQLLLSTKVPFNGVVSCSMVPNLERGDLLILHGENVRSAPGKVTLTKDEFDSFGSEAKVLYQNQTLYYNGSIFSYCVTHQTESICSAFSKSPSDFAEYHGPIKFTYDFCNRVQRNGKPIQREICAKGISYKGANLPQTPDIAVYEPNKGDLFSYSGDIVHRVVARLQYGNQTKYLIKGDNNPIADIQVYDRAHNLGNTPIGSERVKGIVLFKLPFVGFLKLAISSPLNPSLAIAVENCDSYYGELMQ